MQELLELRSHRRLGVRVQSGERLVEEQHAGTARQGAGEGDALALAARQRAGPLLREVRDPKALEQLVDAPVPGVGDVLPDGQVREEGVLLEHEPHTALLRACDRGPCSTSSQASPSSATRPESGRIRPAITPQRPMVLPGTRRPDERDGALDLEREPQLVRAKTECEVR